MKAKKKSAGVTQSQTNWLRFGFRVVPLAPCRNAKALANPRQSTVTQLMVTILATAKKGDEKVVLLPGTVDQRCWKAARYSRKPPAATAIGTTHNRTVIAATAI